MYTYIHTYIHSILEYIHTDIYVCLYMYVCICMCVCMYVCVCMCACMYLCMYVCMYMCVYAYMYMFVCIIYWGELSGGNVLPKTGGGIVRRNCPGGVVQGEMSYTQNTLSELTSGGATPGCARTNARKHPDCHSRRKGTVQII